MGSSPSHSHPHSAKAHPIFRHFYDVKFVTAVNPLTLRKGDPVTAATALPRTNPATPGLMQRVVLAGHVTC
eukprot:143155-Chlamydomonas_euryale.AAC.1